MSDSHRSRKYKHAVVGAAILAALAAIAIAGGFWVQSVYRQSAYDYARQQTANSQGIIRNACARLSPPAQMECASEAIATSRERQRDEYDLYAQRTMALWTLIMGSAAVVGVGLSVFGVILIFLTFEETRKAALATNKILETERKPFLTLTPIDAELVRWNYEKGGVGIPRGAIRKRHEALICSIRSSGRSAAILTAIRRKWAKVPIGEYPPPIDPRAEAERTLFKDTMIPIGPDGIGMAMGSESAPKGRLGEWIWFYGYIEFKDIGDTETYRSGFAYVFNPQQPGRGLVTAMPDRGARKYWYYDDPAIHSRAAHAARRAPCGG